MNNQKSCFGFTLIELLVAMALSLIIVGVVFTLFSSTNKLNEADTGRVYTNQNLRTSLDLIANDLRQAGEGISGSYPISGVDFNSTNKTLTIRRNFSANVTVGGADVIVPNLPICQSLSSTITTIIVVRPTSSTTICPFNSASGTVPDILKPWIAYLSSNSSSPVPALLYNTSSKLATRVNVTAVTPTPTPLTGNSTVTVSGQSNTTASFAMGNSVLLPIDERVYSVDSSGILQLSVNGGPQQAIAYGIQNLSFDAIGVNSSGVTNHYSNFIITDPWSNLQSMTVTIQGSGGTGTQVNRTYATTIYPRNVIQSQ
ncbi:prepilin-type N-terminal cleavage/methylation domain-containing protein (plasmid) [Deinococcus sp. KNUC1210]|uniref:PilW family protein n=1 Tax=Deinococcus sp. KNUC1210 TaxID=2917691 RepID=UPI001EEFEDCC|nr:prepilin-type N-terminal cleavage/methylation domain-containing protein [Deinococcus sp. KNUC1210]ULH17281.1 prepilin-type N-terminal cleavage/methylation domain-containing protein [Deinococcus sp. KNUC1210]